jgi:hypothetical protein
MSAVYFIPCPDARAAKLRRLQKQVLAELRIDADPAKAESKRERRRTPWLE